LSLARFSLASVSPSSSLSFAWFSLSPSSSLSLERVTKHLKHSFCQNLTSSPWQHSVLGGNSLRASGQAHPGLFRAMSCPDVLQHSPRRAAGQHIEPLARRWPCLPAF
jgi:hypothetical protein